MLITILKVRKQPFQRVQQVVTTSTKTSAKKSFYPQDMVSEKNKVE